MLNLLLLVLVVILFAFSFVALHWIRRDRLEAHCTERLCEALRAELEELDREVAFWQIEAARSSCFASGSHSRQSS